MRSWSNCWVGVAINHPGFRSPFAFELGKPLISHRDIPKVIAAKAKSAGIMNRMPMEKIIGAQGMVLPSPSREGMGDGSAPLQKQETSYQPASSRLNLFGQQQSQQPEGA